MTRQAGSLHLGHEAPIATEPRGRRSVATRAVALLLAPADSPADRGRAAFAWSSPQCDAGRAEVRMRCYWWWFAARRCPSKLTAQTPTEDQRRPPRRVGYAPEHTLAAYRLALEMKADFVEPDLAVTKRRRADLPARSDPRSHDQRRGSFPTSSTGSRGKGRSEGGSPTTSRSRRSSGSMPAHGSIPSSRASESRRSTRQWR